ncbi:glycosyltransferase family 9 protein [Prosthecobacter dejongeii]|uniref:ADP-heptose:LPS heptosyltransferase n=1 Tax=Prosthecobacter dejongeii TaxID=48465 RepID=A0A7W7YIJ6_9BACT|nr:glycosyltransferase family 9 protein [Prosthecobacter dejongeii]MBB5036794.1 ADP-heptose:LPS heptosyltransferase [Prosthecobacter dejongeii]
MQRKLILKNFLSPGDIVMLTAAVRDLHRAHPGKFITDVRTPCGDLWLNNPYITPLKDDDPDVEVIPCHYPMINMSNTGAYHFIHGFTRFLSEALGVPIPVTDFKGDIHLSPQEKSWMSQIHEMTGTDIPFWIVVAGGKNDFTIKWWDHQRWQEVVDHFRGRLTFVQVGDKNHSHTTLKRVIDLRGKTDLRQLVRLVYHSDGIISPVTSLMHLAAAVEFRRNPGAFRPCVVVAGGREPNQWEAYPGHQFLHTIGMLSCCAMGGCWRARTLPLGDGDEKDQSLCTNLSGTLPKCMDMISSSDVIRSIELYLTGQPRGSQNSAQTDDLVTLKEKQIQRPIPRKRIINPAANKIELRVVGMRRSGCHAIIDWLCSLYPGKVCFINDVNHQGIIENTRRSDAITKRATQDICKLDESKDLLVHSYEDVTYSQAIEEFLTPDTTGTSGEVIDVVIIRNPFNLFASRIKQWRNDPKNLWCIELLNRNLKGVPAMDLAWIKFAQEYLDLLKNPRQNVVLINYDEWFSSEKYRSTVCSFLKAPHQKNKPETVLGYGFGSSFDSEEYNGKADQMDVQNRWKHLMSDKLFNLMIRRDQRVLELTKEIFTLRSKSLQKIMKNFPSQPKRKSGAAKKKVPNRQSNRQ